MRGIVNLVRRREHSPPPKKPGPRRPSGGSAWGGPGGPPFFLTFGTLEPLRRVGNTPVMGTRTHAVALLNGSGMFAYCGRAQSKGALELNGGEVDCPACIAAIEKREKQHAYWRDRLQRATQAHEVHDAEIRQEVRRAFRMSGDADDGLGARYLLCPVAARSAPVSLTRRRKIDDAHPLPHVWWKDGERFWCNFRDTTPGRRRTAKRDRVLRKELRRL